MQDFRNFVKVRFEHLVIIIFIKSKFYVWFISRGAELIEELRIKQMGLQDEQEKKILEKIKVKMDRIKANQQKIQGPMFKDTTNHFVGKHFTNYFPIFLQLTFVFKIWKEENFKKLHTDTYSNSSFHELHLSSNSKVPHCLKSDLFVCCFHF